ncbi:hypothetical protein AJ80_09462 [Polytolypa hystricis UAMH7299]|uniref:DUF7820 domain-containing protein n=1 Tax=Polytolypa hystricis (strain UAMH7299) TaxID=1447883 RepID=A0A2B7WPX3_POLH7|nr:hypothetical protein AJ80_09462 [Polytolypa hystricis UAMH7299]
MSGRPRSPYQSHEANDENNSVPRLHHPHLETPLSDGSSAGDVSPIADVFSDHFALEPLDRPSIDRPSLSARSSASNLRAAEDGLYPHISPFLDPPDLLQEDMSHPSEPPAEPAPDDASSNSTSTPRAPSVASSANYDAASIANRSVSTSSRFSIPRALSPYTGQTGPSHPYSMYPQGIGVGRSSSISSSSTIRPPDRNPITVAPPQHPYSMYPQNTVPEEESLENQPPVSIPVGFPGHDPLFRLPPRQGPDELGDIVGPDGHTERLPPYSRFPDGIPPKEGAELQIIAADTPQEAVDASPVSPESGISSRTLLDTSRVVAATPEPQTSDSGGNLTEKLKQKGKRKVCCGMSIWTCVLIGAVLLIGTVIGGVIGGILGNVKGEKAGGASASSSLSNLRPTESVFVTVTSTTLLDATRLTSTPKTVLPMETGTFNIPEAVLKRPDRKRSCVEDDRFNDMWRCLRLGTLDYSISKNKDGRYLFQMHSGHVSGQFRYGAQAPVFRAANFSRDLMLDKKNTSLGPAQFLLTEFDKLVIAPEEEFRDMMTRRSVNGADLLRRGHAWEARLSTVGERPYFCWWNSTYLELFIYVNRISDSGKEASLSSFTTTPYADPTALAEHAPVMRLFDLDGDDNDNDDDDDDDDNDNDPTSKLRHVRGSIDKPYPRVTKLIEKRIVRADIPDAYCIQLQILDNGSLSPPISEPIKIDEVDPDDGSIGSKRGIPDESSCCCQWLAE